MTAPARIAVVVLALAAILTGSYALGNAVGPLGDSGDTPEGTAHADEGHGDEATSPSAGADGLAIASGELRLVPAKTTLPARRRSSFAFRVVDDRGAAVRDYDVAHERKMHLIVAARDLSSFQHLHPSLGADGVWRAEVAPLEPGVYRAFADFRTAGRTATLGVDLTVPGDVAPRALPRPSGRAGVDGYEITLHADPIIAGVETPLRFEVTRSGSPVVVEPYLGARGHLVVLREGDLAYLHTHPEADTPSFRATLPSAGRYRAFLQVSAGGAVRTAAFTLEAR
jgi:hypothetical protein